MEFHAAERDVLALALKMVQEICSSCRARNVKATASSEERRRLWHARHHAYETALRKHPGESFIIVDVAVPISRYPALVAQVRHTLQSENKVGYMLGHAGDGNLHVLLPFHDSQTYAEARDVNEEIVLQAIALEGTATGEHGVGIGKARYMAREHGDALDIMRRLKETLDPRGILNPGKIFPQETHSCANAGSC
jgi:D-lactate dehydrogenase (cytochrome)